MSSFTLSKPSEHDDEIDLTRLFKAINRVKWRILGLSLLVTTLSIFASLSMQPIYQSSATLLIEAQQARAIQIDEVYGINSGQGEYYSTQFEILKSRSIAERVYDDLNLAKVFEVKQEPSMLAKLRAMLSFLPQEIETRTASEIANIKRIQMLDVFSKNIKISPVSNTQLVRISYLSPDPRLAAKVANAIGEAYINSQLEAKVGITQKANSWLGGRLGELRHRLDASELKLEQYRHQHGLVDLKGVTSLDAQELERLSDEITVARSRFNQAESFMQVVRKYGASNISRLESLPEVTSHASVQNVKKEAILVERKVSELSKVYGPKHPKMIAAQAELASVKESLRLQIGRLVQGIEDEAQTAKQNLLGLERQFGQAKSQFQSLSSVETNYRRLTREVETNRQLFESFLSRQKETEVTGDFDSPVARFTDRAVLPTSPVKPKKSLIAVLAFIASLGVGVMLAIVLDVFNDTVKSLEDVELILSQRALGYLPKSEKRTTEEQRSFAFFDNEQKLHAEAVRSIRTSLSLLSIDKPLQVIEVTSSYPGEGKTSVSMNLGFAFSGLERVLIIDADMRKPMIGKRFDLPPYQAGLANYLSGTDALDDCIVCDVRDKVDVMPAGAIPLNPLELLASPRFEPMLAQLKQTYNKIIVDTPPVQAVSDPLVLLKYTDAVVLTVKAEQIRSGAIKQTIGQINQAQGSISGVVLNHFDVKNANSYYGQYGYYQAYDAEEPA
ncbi:GumC family protein [Shewanella gelidii]|uniref:non-specific protein-tyrosine kinase n=1 Tax=Shewanella gelidii TaxID=1642821 RepID=A0A917N8T0_9GAMM|nr:polysaccharide biosynthesis tyrosine autokinase [Shewanella gelidii]MCL1099482.1 polysaccharide biosynthesis tyrosine autokinase [Shewanella gelidii]GGI77308.1 chain-length determining protein [Shewanella gelidii]